MLPEKSLQTPGLATVRSASSHLSVDDHEVNLEAIQSQAISIGEVAGEFTSEQKYFILRRLNYEGLVNLNELPVGATFMLEKISALNEAEAVEILKEYIEAHYEDVNIPDADYQFAQKLIDEAPNNLNSGAGDIKTHLKSHFDAGSDEKQLSDTNVADSTSIESITQSPFELFDWSFQVRVEAGLIAYHSPYPEIRAVTEPYDDPSVPCETPRAIIVGIIWLAIGVVINQFFYDRQPSISFTSAVAQLFIYPSGKLLALILPKWSFTIWKHTIDLNPGPWNEKEQMLATLIFSIAGGSTSYVTSNITVQKLAKFYDNNIFTNTGEYYAVTEVLNSNNLLDKQKYDEVGPPFYSAANLVLYGIFKTIRNFRTSTYEGFNDPHSRMMARYKEVPEWCFLCVLVISIVLAILCVELYPTETPVWGIFFAVGINFVFLTPITTIYSVTGFLFGLNVLVELIVGYALPGNGLALMFIKALGYNIDGQADNFISNQKMGHYAKVPPRAMFRWQIVGTFIASFIALGIINFTIDDIKDYCEPDNKLKFTCPESTVFYSSSILWGVIGPKRVFNQLYPILRWCFLVGFLLVFPCVAFKKYGPKKAAKYFQPTLIIGGFLIYAPYNLAYYTGGLYMSIAFMWYLRSRYTTWWEKYNYVLSGGLDAGVAFSAIIIFFAVQYHDKSINWWGNTVSTAGLDGAGLSLKNATLSAPDGYFGPRKSEYVE
ncbi:hypothetical protein QCA50_015755 [Cerrena zonata]|uniref:Oligopeptide transporter 2 n=1 Tax=Cerrena zonata TaxID=2478898 RepID=A0AAW0FQC3_9APHY